MHMRAVAWKEPYATAVSNGHRLQGQPANCLPSPPPVRDPRFYTSA